MLDVRLTERYGIANYPFGPRGHLDVTVEARRAAADEPVVRLQSDVALTVVLQWAGGTREIMVGPSAV